jgi:hypothetical protein
MPRIDFTQQQIAPTGVPDLAMQHPNQAFNQLGQAADQADRVLQQIKQRDAALTGAQALADFRMQRQQRQVELRTSAKTPDGFVETALTDFDEHAQQMIDQHEDPDVQMFLEQRLIDARDSEASESIQWQAAAMQTRSEALAVDTINKYGNMVNTAPGAFQSALKDVDAMIQATGLDMIHADKLRGVAKSTLSRSAVYGQIEKNPSGVLHELQSGKWDAYLDTDAKIAAVNGAQTELKRRESEALANQAQARQEALFNIDRWSRDNTASLQASGKPVPPPYDDSQLRSMLKPQQYEAVKLSADRAHALFQATGDMRTQTPAQMSATVERLKPVPGSEGFADQLALYKVAVDNQKDIEKARAADPGLAVRQAVPAVQAAWQTFEKSQKPEDLQAAVKQSFVAQAALGIPTSQQAAMPHGFATAFAGSINSAKPEDAAKQLQGAEASFGPYWNKAFLQMRKLLDGNVKVAATVKDRVSAALLVEGSRQSVSALRRAAGVKDDDTGIAYAVSQDPRVAKLATSLSQRAGGSGTATQIQSSIEVLALSRMRVYGESQSAATDAAIQRVVGDRYDFGVVGNRPFRVPNDVANAEMVSAGATDIRNKVATKGLDLPYGYNMPKSWFDYSYAASIQRNGYWVTNDDESGAVLYSERGVPVTVNGKPLQYTFKELESRGRLPVAVRSMELDATLQQGVF